MQFRCANCKRIFEFEDFIDFCPYCGNELSASALTRQGQRASTSDLVKAIDSIWGEDARLREEFSEAIKRCIYLINDYADAQFEKILPKQTITKFDEKYASIKQSNNRKTLISRLSAYLDALDEIINNLSDRIPADITSRLEGAAHDIEDQKKELYDFLGLRHTAYHMDYTSDEGFSADILYSRDQLRVLYNLVIVAFAKYKKCVEDNNMFAAFASTSDYGVMKNGFRRLLSWQRSDDEEDEADLNFEQIIEYMKSHNSMKYYGLLDEDFVPHVDAFWYGLEALCECIDHHISYDCNYDGIYVEDAEKARILRFIGSNAFEVTNYRIESALELRDRFEMKLSPKTKMSCNIK